MRPVDSSRRALAISIAGAGMLAVLMTRQAVAAGELLTWEQCVEAVAQGNPAVVAARSTLRSSDYQVRGAYSGYFPQLQASLNYTYGTGSTSNLGSGSAPTLIPGAGTSRDQSTWSAQLSVSENLFAGFQDESKVRQARANREVALATFDATRARISYDLKSAFAGMLYAQRSTQLTDEIIRRRQDNFDLVELRFDSGGENQGSVLLSKANLEQAKFDRLQAGNALETSRAQLARVLGRDAAAGLAVSGAVPAGPPPPAETDLEALTRLMPDYRQADAQERSADAAFAIARAPLMPTFNLTGTTSNSGSDFPPSNHRWAIGASLVFPFFSGGRDYYATKSASELHKAAALAKDNALRVGIAKLRSTLNGFREAVQQLEVTASFVKATGTRALIARQKYNNGLLTFEDWDIIESDSINRQKSLIQAERDRVVAEAAWEQAQGKGVLP